jgi:hypothetical protein
MNRHHAGSRPGSIRTVVQAFACVLPLATTACGGAPAPASKPAPAGAAAPPAAPGTVFDDAVRTERELPARAEAIERQHDADQRRQLEEAEGAAGGGGPGR